MVSIPLGASVPALTPHAISVSLPTWRDNVGYEEGDKRVVDRMETGYPRFFIHRSIQKLASLCLTKFGRPDELCILLPSPKVATAARDFLANQTPAVAARIVEFVICPTSGTPAATPTSNVSVSANGNGASATSSSVIELQILLFNKDNWAFAKAFWQHTGDGISSRRAERALAYLGETPAGQEAITPTSAGEQGAAVGAKNTAYYSKNRHYARRANSAASGITAPSPSTPVFLPTPSRPNPPTTTETIEENDLTVDLTTYLEERYGRNLPLFNAPLAKQALKRRIAGGLLPSDEDYGKIADVERGGGQGKKSLTADDIYLYPTGMSAIWHAHDVARVARRRTGAEGKSVCYGFPYTDTLKILQKWGDGCHFLGNGGTQDIPALEQLCKEGRERGETPLLSLSCEFPGNPLLTSPDLARIRKLADEYGFIVVVDETIGNFINVEVAQYADIVVSSLSKIFSGDANVMGGSLVLSPNSQHYDLLKDTLATEYEDNYFAEDAVYMERNSRDYRGRIKRINDTTFDICEWLVSRSLESDDGAGAGAAADSAPRKALKKVYYPRYMTPEVYDQARRQPTLGKGGYGGLFSLTFTSMEASEAFFDALDCAKGPSLGTSFTLACPYVILAHYFELDWVQSFGVEPGLVRVSMGEEDISVVKGWFEKAVLAAEATLA